VGGRNIPPRTEACAPAGGPAAVSLHRQTADRPAGGPRKKTGRAAAPRCAEQAPVFKTAPQGAACRWLPPNAGRRHTARADVSDGLGGTDRGASPKKKKKNQWLVAKPKTAPRACD